MAALPFNLSSRGGLARQLVSATLGGAIVRIAGMALTFLVGVQLARHLGPEGYGIYGTVMAVVLIMLVPAQMGLHALAIRDISVAMATRDFGAAKGAIMWFSVAIAVASLLVGGIGAGITLLFGSPDKLNTHAYLWGCITVPLMAVSTLGVSILRGFNRVLTAQLYDALLRPSLLAVAIFTATLAFSSFDASTAVALQAATSAGALFITVLKVVSLLTSEITQATSKARPDEWRRSAMSITGTEIVRTVDGQYAVFLVGMLASLHDAGIFRVALATAGFIGLPLTLINLVVMPYIAQFHATDDVKRLKMIVSGAAIFTFGSTLLIALASAAFGEVMLAKVFGTAYRDGWSILMLLSLGFAVNGFFGSLGGLLNMTGHERVVTSAFALGFMFNLIMSITLFSLLGVDAVGVAFIGSELLKGIFMQRVARRKLKIDSTAISGIVNIWRHLRSSAVAPRSGLHTNE